MAETMQDMKQAGAAAPNIVEKVVAPSAEELAIARDLVRSARARGAALTGPDGLLKALTKTVIETPWMRR